MDSRLFLQACLVVLVVVLLAEGKKHDILEAQEEKIRNIRDVEVEIDYEPVGCFRDEGSTKNKALNKLVKNFRLPGSLPGGKKIWDYWEDMSYIIQLCAEDSFRQGYTAMFGLQFFGECWSGDDALSRYDKYGSSGNCVNGVGKASTNYIYRIKAKPLPVRAASSICHVEGQTYDDGDSMELYKGDLNSGECHQCTCTDGELIDCHHIFHCVLNDSSCNSYTKNPGQCCPTCERDVPANAPVCKVDDQTYKQGDGLELLRNYYGKQLSECHQCTCMAGKLEQCHRIYYCEKNRPGCTNYVKIPGQCCPKCARVSPKPAPPYCEVGARHYKDGESMEVLHMSADQKTGECHQCSCKGGKIDGCHHIFHCQLDNPDCVRYEQRVDQCCPACVLANPKPPASSCKINGQLYKDGESAEVLKGSADKSNIFCQQCKCKAGKHSCHKIFDCDIQKQGCEKFLKVTGQCCPVCACYHNGEQLSAGDQWQKVSGDYCVACTCQQGGIAHCTRKPGSCQSE